MEDEIILAATRLLSDRKNWCMGSWAIDKSGNVVAPASDAAVKWDLAGSIYKCARDLGFGVDGATRAIETLERRASKDNLLQVNDEGGYHEVMRLLRSGVIPAETPDSLITWRTTEVLS